MHFFLTIHLIKHDRYLKYHLPGPAEWEVSVGLLIQINMLVFAVLFLTAQLVPLL